MFYHCPSRLWRGIRTAVSHQTNDKQPILGLPINDDNSDFFVSDKSASIVCRLLSDDTQNIWLEILRISIALVRLVSFFFAPLVFRSLVAASIQDRLTTCSCMPCAGLWVHRRTCFGRQTVDYGESRNCSKITYELYREVCFEARNISTLC